MIDLNDVLVVSFCTNERTSKITHIRTKKITGETPGVSVTSQAVVNGDAVDVRCGVVGMVLSDQPRCNVKVFVIKSKVKWCVTVRITMISVRTFLHQKLTSTKRAGSTRNTKHGTS